MRKAQKKFLGAALAVSSIAGIVAPSVTAMATIFEDEENAKESELRSIINEYSVKLEKNPIFANYHRVEYAADRLAKYDAAEAEATKQTIIKYADKVYTKEVKIILDKMSEFAQTKKMQLYNDLVNIDLPALEEKDKENAQYLMGRLNVWGEAVVFEYDRNYATATNSIMNIRKLADKGKFDEAEEQVKTARNDIKNIRTYDINGKYLESKLEEEEEYLANAIEQSTLNVRSAEAINAREIKVVFNKEIDEDSAEDTNNYNIYIGKDDKKMDKFKAELQDDNKTVILQINNKDNKDKLTDEYYIENGQSYKVNVKNVLDRDGEKVDSYEGSFKIFDDNTPPELLNTEYLGSTIKFTFDEPLSEKDIPNVKIDNTSIKKNDDKYKFSQDPGEYTLSVSLKDAPNKVSDYGDHDVKVSGVKDCAGNTADVIKTSYEANEDNEKPQVEEITAESENSFRIKFNTEIDEDDFINGKLKNNIEVKKGSHTFTEDQFEKSKGKYIEKVNDKENTYEITLNNNKNDDNPLYDDDENSIKLSIEVKGYKGTNDVTGDDYETNITLSKDDDEPEIKSDNLNRVERRDNKDYLAIIFNKDLDKNEVKEDKISVSRDGVKKKVKGAKVDEDKKNKLLIELKENDNLGKGKYRITLEKGAIKDKSGNKNESITTILNYDNDNGESFTLKSKAITVNGDNASKVPGSTEKLEEGQDRNIIIIDFDVEMDDSALDPDNYTVDGRVLENDDRISFIDDDKTRVEIELENGNIDEEHDEVEIALSQDIKADDGRYLVDRDEDGDPVENDKDYRSKICLLDDTKPEVDTVELIKNKSKDTVTNTLKVKFTEKLAPIDKNKAIKDFNIKYDGDEKDIESVNIGEDSDTLIIKLKKTMNINTSGRIVLEVTDNKDDKNKGEISLTDKSIFKNKVEAIEKEVTDVLVEGEYNKLPQITVNCGENEAKVFEGDSENTVVTNKATLTLTKNSDNINEDDVSLTKNENTIEVKDLLSSLKSENGYKLPNENLKDDGTYVLTVKDKYDNTTKVTIVIDNTAPDVVVTDGTNPMKEISKGEYITNSELVKITSEAKDIKTVKVDNEVKENTALKDGITINKEGIHNIEIVDDVGNKKEIKVIIDRKAPVAVLNQDSKQLELKENKYTANANNPISVVVTDDTNVIVKVKAPGNDSKEVILDKTDKGEYIVPQTADNKNLVGDYILTITDAAGNITTVNITIS